MGVCTTSLRLRFCLAMNWDQFETFISIRVRYLTLIDYFVEQTSARSIFMAQNILAYIKGVVTLISH